MLAQAKRPESVEAAQQPKANRRVRGAHRHGERDAFADREAGDDAPMTSEQEMTRDRGRHHDELRDVSNQNVRALGRGEGDRRGPEDQEPARLKNPDQRHHHRVFTEPSAEDDRHEGGRDDREPGHHQQGAQHGLTAQPSYGCVELGRVASRGRQAGQARGLDETGQHARGVEDQQQDRRVVTERDEPRLPTDDHAISGHAHKEQGAVEEQRPREPRQTANMFARQGDSVFSTGGQVACDHQHHRSCDHAVEDGHEAVRGDYDEQRHDQAGELASEHDQALQSEVVAPLDALVVEVRETADDGGEGKQADGRHQLRRLEKLSDEAREEHERGADREAAHDLRQVGDSLNGWVVALRILDQKPVAAEVAEEFEKRGRKGPATRPDPAAPDPRAEPARCIG